MGRRLRRARSLALDVSPLRHSRAYRALWLGQIVSLTGSQMRTVAVAWQVFLLTDSTAAVGLIGLVEIVPLIVFSIVGGAYADSMDRRRLVAISTTGMIVSSGVLAAVSFAPDPSVIAIYALTAVSSGFSAAERPARAAMVPGLVGIERLPAAMALRQVAFQVTLIVGPALGGAMIGVFDVAWVYVVDTVSFIAAFASLIWVPRMAPEPAESPSRIESVREGLRYSFRTPLILSIFLIDFLAMVFGMPRAVFPALATEVFQVDAGGVGLLYAAPSVGALIAALTAGWVSRIDRQGVAVIVSVGLWGAAISLAGLCTFSLALTLVWLAVAGGADVVSAIFRGTMLQAATPDHLLGRVNAANLMVVTGGPRVGDIEAGFAAEWIGVEPSIVAGGIGCLAGTAAVAVGIPVLRGYRRVRPPAAAETPAGE